MSEKFEDPFLKDPKFKYHREDPTRKYPVRDYELNDDVIFVRVFGGAILVMVVLLLLLGWLI